MFFKEEKFEVKLEVKEGVFLSNTPELFDLFSSNFQESFYMIPKSLRRFQLDWLNYLGEMT